MEDRAGGSHGGSDASRLGGDSRDVFSAEEPLGPQAEHRTGSEQAGEDEGDVGRRRFAQKRREEHHPDNRESQGGAAEGYVHELRATPFRGSQRVRHSSPANHGVNYQHDRGIRHVARTIDSIVSC